jgi:hypothetical protein
VALRNANKPHAACAAFAQALYHCRPRRSLDAFTMLISRLASPSLDGEVRVPQA